MISEKEKVKKYKREENISQSQFVNIFCILFNSLQHDALGKIHNRLTSFLCYPYEKDENVLQNIYSHY